MEFPFHDVKTNRGRDRAYANHGCDHARVPRALHAPRVPSAGDIASMDEDCTHSSAASARLWEHIEDNIRISIGRWAIRIPGMGRIMRPTKTCR
jgi:hypothetical protein